MIPIRELRDEFLVDIMNVDAYEAERQALVLEQAGYRVRRFYDLESFLQNLKQEPSHVVVFDLSRWKDLDEDFAHLSKSIQRTSDEVSVLVLHRSDQAIQILNHRNEWFVADLLEKPWSSSLELLHRVDKLCERFILIDSSQASSIPWVEARVPAPEHFLAFQENISLIYDKDTLVQYYINYVSQLLKDKGVIYLKYLAHPHSLALYQSAWINSQDLSGMGIALQKNQRLPENLYSFAPLKEFLETLFGQKQFFIQKVRVGDTLEGLVVGFSEVSTEGLERELKAGLWCLEAQINRAELLKKNHQLQQVDQTTGVFNKRAILGLIEEEILRSRQTHLAVSLLVFSLDRPEKFRATLGDVEYFQFFKHLTAAIKYKQRAIDRLGVFDDGTFLFLLPFTAKEGAFVKAQRLLHVVMNSTYKILKDHKDLPVTLSIGVAEYPSLCHDADGLFRLADEAHMAARNDGGGRIVLGQPQAQFVADFKARRLSKGVEGET